MQQVARAIIADYRDGKGEAAKVPRTAYEALVRDGERNVLSLDWQGHLLAFRLHDATDRLDQFLKAKMIEYVIL